jgi:predicted nucleic acid-binding protein
MSELIVDSCVVAKWVLPESDSGQAQRIIDEFVPLGGRLILLDIAVVEVTNAIWKRFHRGQAKTGQTETMLNFFLSIPCSIEPAIPHLHRALEIARAYQRSVYDALFVALAEHLGVDGITADEPLYNAVHGDFPSVRLLRDW